MVTGLQERFDWRGVAASAAGAGVGQAVGSALGGVDFGLNNFGNQLVRGTLTGFAAGTTAAVMRGGRVSVQQIATDAFGNALGSSLADGSFNGASQNEAVLQGAGPWSDRDYVNGLDLQSDSAAWSRHVSAAHGAGGGVWDNAPLPSMADRYAQTYDGEATQTGGGSKLPAGWRMDNGRMVAPAGTDMGPLRGAVNINIPSGPAEQFEPLHVNRTTGMADFRYTTEQMRSEGQEAFMEMMFDGVGVGGSSASPGQTTGSQITGSRNNGVRSFVILCI